MTDNQPPNLRHIVVPSTTPDSQIDPPTELRIGTVGFNFGDSLGDEPDDETPGQVDQ